VSLDFNGVQLCTVDVFDGACMQESITMPTVSETSAFPATAKYTSPSGAVTTVTLEIADHP
jgi:hypothetical protein